MNRELDPARIRQQLNRSAARLDQPTLEKLRGARMQALAHHDARQAAPAYALANVLSGFRHGAGSHRNHYYWALLILLAACLFSGIAYWQQTPGNDESDLDIAILTDEMPVVVYID